MKYAIYDLEIKHAIPSPLSATIAKDFELHHKKPLKFCGGWTDYKGMGISIGAICWGDTLNPQDLKTYTTQNIADLHKQLTLLSREGYVCGGFNTKNFDDKLLTANGHPFSSQIDIYQLIKQKVGQQKVGYSRPKSISLSLDSLSKINGLKKNGRGEDAPLLYQSNNIDKLTNYVQRDVLVEFQILIKFLNNKLRIT